MQVNGHVHLYFESAAVIVTLVLLGQVLELKARRRTGDAIRLLLALTPDKAHLVKDGQEIDVPLSKVQRGDMLRLKPGEKVPVDGIVIDGKSTIDASMLTGEAMPVAVGPGDSVVGGTVNRDGSLLIRAEKSVKKLCLPRSLTW